VSDAPGRRLLVTGCGRSGTKFTAVLLQRLGLDVRHERMGRDGIAAWTLAVPSARPPWGPAVVPESFDHVYHQVRHPLAVIRSVGTFKPSSWEHIYDHTSATPRNHVIVRGARYWLEWNEHTERIATWRYRIESLNDVFEELCSRLGIPADRAALEQVPADCNTRLHGRLFHYYDELSTRLRLRRSETLAATLARPRDLPPVEWADLEVLDPLLARRVRAKAREYGYRA
jgi:hypothetical protein